MEELARHGMSFLMVWNESADRSEIESSHFFIQRDFLDTLCWSAQIKYPRLAVFVHLSGVCLPRAALRGIDYGLSLTGRQRLAVAAAAEVG
jgi:hypothetical protein